MLMDNHDWLDERLAADSYIPDDGFTARVVRRLPARSTRAEVQRRRILMISAFVAFCLVAVQLVPLFDSARQFLIHHSPVDLLGEMIELAQRPAVVLRAAAAMAVLALVSIPFLRRWA